MEIKVKTVNVLADPPDFTIKYDGRDNTYFLMLSRGDDKVSVWTRRKTIEDIKRAIDKILEETE